MIKSRTHNCGELRSAVEGKEVTLCGWVEDVREVGGSLSFIILRDFYGITQLVAETEDMVSAFKNITKESTVQITGKVRIRSNKNDKIPTGDIEVVPDSVKVLGKNQNAELPFEINRSKEADKATRLNY